MGTKHDLKEYYFAKECIRDFPFIQKELDKTYKMLYSKRQYLLVQHVLDAIADSREMLNRQYKHYKVVLEKKGKVDK